MASTAQAPPALRPGDTVAVCAPAGPVDERRLQAGLALLAERYRVMLVPGTLDRTGFLAGADPARAQALNQCLQNPDVRAVICARGGYGVMRILPDLDADALRRDPKLIVGFSDITALLAWAYVCAGVRGIHGPMVGQLPNLSAADVAWLFTLMESPKPPQMPKLALTPPVPPAQPHGDATSDAPNASHAPNASPAPALASAANPSITADAITGRLMGGNLCLLSHLLGTPYQLDFADAILFTEEVGEPAYRLDRYLTHLGLAGALDGVRAAIIGDLTDCSAGTSHPSPDTVVAERLHQRQIPTATRGPWGHGARNLALPIGARATLSGLHPGQDITLHLIDSAVT